MASPSYFTWSMAEELAVGHMKAIGFPDAKRTRAGADGGIDVTSARAVAQVKHHAVPIGIAEVQRLKGAARGGLIALFYSSSGYTAAARTWANAAGVALFEFTTANEVEPANQIARGVGGGARAAEELPERAGSILLMSVLWEMSLPRVNEHLDRERARRFATEQSRQQNAAAFDRFSKAAGAVAALTNAVRGGMSEIADPAVARYEATRSTMQSALDRCKEAMAYAGMPIDALIYPAHQFRWTGVGWEFRGA